MPGINLNIAERLLIRADSYDLGGYIKLGGNPDKVIAHWLGEDQIVEPLWNPSALAKRIAKLHEWGTKYLIASDFSTWFEFPLVVQFYNVYRTALVTHDLAQAGFKIIPCVKPIPQWWDIYNGWVPRNLKTVFIDLHHVGSSTFNWNLMRDGAQLFKRDFPNTVPWLWAYTPTYAQWWAANIGACVWVPTRSYMMNKVIRTRQKLTKEANGSTTKPARKSASKSKAHKARTN